MYTLKGLQKLVQDPARYKAESMFPQEMIDILNELIVKPIPLLKFGNDNLSLVDTNLSSKVTSKSLRMQWQRLWAH